MGMPIISTCWYFFTIELGKKDWAFVHSFLFFSHHLCCIVKERQSVAALLGDYSSDSESEEDSPQGSGPAGKGQALQKEEKKEACVSGPAERAPPEPDDYCPFFPTSGQETNRPESVIKEKVEALYEKFRALEGRPNKFSSIHPIKPVRPPHSYVCVALLRCYFIPYEPRIPRLFFSLYFLARYLPLLTFSNKLKRRRSKMDETKAKINTGATELILPSMNEILMNTHLPIRPTKISSSQLFTHAFIGSGIGFEEAKAIAGLLKSNTSVTKLDLYFTGHNNPFLFTCDFFSPHNSRERSRNRRC